MYTTAELTSHTGYQLPDDPMAQARGLLKVPWVHLGTKPPTRHSGQLGTLHPRQMSVSGRKNLVSSEEKPQASQCDSLDVLYTGFH